VRVFVAIDVSNLFKTCQLAHGGEARVDFELLYRKLSSLYENSEFTACAYTVTNPLLHKKSQNPFVVVLKAFGYQVKERFLRWEKGLVKPMRSDWDVGITIDAVHLQDTYDTFVLVSGDGDFSMLLSHLRIQHKKTVVLAFEGSAARSLYANADELVWLDKDILFRSAS